jgi:DNA-binding NarL/FixJ family response regulator
MSNINKGLIRSEGLTPEQEDVAMMIASGKAIQDVAEELDVHRSTVWR